MPLWGHQIQELGPKMLIGPTKSWFGGALILIMDAQIMKLANVYKKGAVGEAMPLPQLTCYNNELRDLSLFCSWYLSCVHWAAL